MLLITLKERYLGEEDQAVMSLLVSSRDDLEGLLCNPKSPFWVRNGMGG